MVDQEISQHRAAEGSDERCHHRVSQGRTPLSQNRKCERFWTLPITRPCRLVLPRPHRSLRCGDRIMLLDSREWGKRNCKLPGPQTRKPCNLKSTKPPKNDSRSVG